MTSKSGSPKLILGDNFVSRWIFITILSTVGGSIIGLLISQPLVCMRTIHTDIIGVILLGSTIGAAIGLGQSYQMKDLMQVPHWWIVANIFGWMIAILLFEFYAPIARCFISTNAPLYYSPLNNIIHRQLSVIAEQIERMIAGEFIRGTIYYSVKNFLHSLILGTILGLPLGISQYFGLRRDIPRSSILIGNNIIGWNLAVICALYITYINYKWTLLALILLFVIPPAIIASTMKRLTRNIRINA